MSKQQVAFIGLGVMGYPMAGHLAKAGIRPGYTIALLQKPSSGVSKTRVVLR